MNRYPKKKYEGRVALFHGPEKAIELISVEWPHPVGEEILIQISHSAICRSDVHTMCGRRHVDTPTVLGHEIIGSIVAFGSQAARKDVCQQALNKGDRVTWAIYAHCGNCFYCQRGLPQKCEHLFKYGHEPVSPTGQGSSGGMADYILLKPGTPILKLPDIISPHPATPINCAVSTAMAMLRESALVFDGATKLVVMGGGYAGLCAVAMAKARGCGHVTVFESNRNYYDRAFAFGADAVCHPDDFSMKEKEGNGCLTQGSDAVFELAGSTDAALLGMKLLRTGGCLILAGTVFPSPPLSMDPDQIVRRCLKIIGNHNYRPEDLVRATRFMAEEGSGLPWDELIGAEFALHHAQDAVEYAKAHPGKRAVIRANAE